MTKVKCVDCLNFKNIKGTTDTICTMNMIVNNEEKEDDRKYPLLGAKTTKETRRYLYYRGKFMTSLNRECPFFVDMSEDHPGLAWVEKRGKL